jgi:mannose-6-phosphate isomerase-like protein (cupin superfamily)
MHQERRPLVSHTEGIAHDHKISAVAEERTHKALAYVPAGEGTSSLWVFGEIVTHKIPRWWTGGAYSLFEVTTQPGAESPPHVQHREDEFFYVLGGEYEFSIGEDVFRVGAASLLYIPKGTLHAHRNAGEGVGRMLVNQTPGGLYQRYFDGVGKPADSESGPLVFENPQKGCDLTTDSAARLPPPLGEALRLCAPASRRVSAFLAAPERHSAREPCY